MTDGSPDGGLLDVVCRHAERLDRTTSAPLRRMRVEADGASVEVEWGQPGSATPVESSGAAAEEQAVDGQVRVNAPTVGVFYRAPEPGAPPFVRPGDEVEPGQQLGILEAMKLMNAIVAERPGRITEILVQDATPVEYGQPLFVIDPVAG